MNSKTLYIVRHAKSSWSYKGVDDIDRPLKRKGIETAYKMSKILTTKILRPELFLSSIANRALHTSIIFASSFEYPISNLEICKSLYNFNNNHLSKFIKSLDDCFNSAIIFSHNHGINKFVNDFGSENIENVPTCGIVGIKFNSNHWNDVKKGKTFLLEFPKHYKR